MKLAFLVSSAINLDETINQGFSYSKNRSFFSSEERFRQTQYTINSINLVCPESTIYLYDNSLNFQEYAEKLSYVNNLKFISLERLDPMASAITRSHPSKGYCEALGTEVFFKNFIEELDQYDFVTKISGRYFYSTFDTRFFNQENKNKFLFKQFRNWEWSDAWKFPDFLKISHKLFWAPTQTYSIGQNQIQNFYKNFLEIGNYYRNNPQTSNHIDFECLMYYFVLHNQPVAEVSWEVGGWTGAMGDYQQW